MVALGIFFGLLAAFFLACSYIFSRLFVTKTEKSVVRLFVASHVVMGLVSVVMFLFLLPEEMPALKSYLRPLLQASGCYLLGQIILFWIMNYAEASRISPLLGIKVVILALITVLVLGETLSVQKWIAVFLCTAAAFLLNFTGGTLPRRVIIAGLALCTTYSLSDLGIADLIDSMRQVSSTGSGQVNKPSLLAACICYIVCGMVGLVLLPVSGLKRTFVNWRYSMSFAFCWFMAMLCLFVCFGYVGPVFGNVLQSTRGVISVLVGAVLASMGHVILEQEQPGHVVLRRTGAALLMCIAVWLFVTG